jgi:two-component system, LuxR family, sensor kinase FixL
MTLGSGVDVPAFGALLEATSDALLIADSDGRISQINAQIETLFGYGRAELLGQNLQILFPERFHGDSRFPLRCQDDQQRVGAGVELFGRRKDGTEFPAEVSLSQMAVHGASLFVASIRDGTAHRYAEAERVKLLQAQEAIRLRDEFLSIASHELRTPLTPIQLQIDGALRAARRGGEQDLPIITRKLEALGNGIHRLASLVNQLLDLSRITSGRLDLERTEVDLVALIHRSLVAFEDEALGVECPLEFEVQADMIHGRWDSSRLEQVLTNLLSNALRYGAGRPVGIVMAELRGGWATLLVRDQGIGVAEEHHELIFQRFERVTEARNRGGFGLGLWIVRQIVEAHGGKISIFSRPGVGSTFAVELPLANGRPAATHDEVILLVDDDPAIRGAFRDFLDGHDPWPVTACTGFDALALLHFGFSAQAILVSPSLPVMEGTNYIEELSAAARARNVPLVWLVEPGQATSALPGPRLEKPFSPEALRSFIADTLRTAVSS